jgi:hypothetical protein
LYPSGESFSAVPLKSTNISSNQSVTQFRIPLLKCTGCVDLKGHNTELGSYSLIRGTNIFTFPDSRGLIIGCTDNPIDNHEDLPQQKVNNPIKLWFGKRSVQSWPISRFYSSNCLDEMRKIKNLPHKFMTLKNINLELMVHKPQ